MFDIVEELKKITHTSRRLFDERQGWTDYLCG